MVYHRVSDAIRRAVDHPVPRQQLVDFSRVSMAKGATARVSFAVTDEYFVLTDKAGEHVLYAGDHYFDITNGVNSPQTFTIRVQAPKKLRSHRPLY